MKLKRAMIITLILAMALGLVSCTSISPTPSAPVPTPTPEESVPTPTPEQLYQQYLNQGDAYLDQELWDEAIGEYNKAIEFNPEFAEAYAQRALAILLEQEYNLTMDCLCEAAIRDAEKALALNPAIDLDRRLARAYVFQGDCYYEDREFEEAIASYTKAMELDPNISCRTPIDVYWELLYDSLTDREYDKAIEYANKAIELNTGNSDYYYRQLAEAYYGRGLQNCEYWEPDEAIADFTKAIELNPDEAKYYYYRGWTYYELADYYWNAGQVFEEADSNNRAIADFTRAIELEPAVVFAYLYRGNCYGANGDYNRAIIDYTRAIELGIEDIDFAYFNRAGAYRELGNKNEAIADYKRAIALTEDDFVREQSLKYIEELQSD